MTEIEKMIQNELFSLADEKYKDFSSKLMPTIDKNIVIGVRTPELRKLSKKVFKEWDYDSFLSALPHKYYEENNLHGFIIEQIKDYEKLIFEIDRFLPFVDNWATCDLMSPKIFKKHKSELIVKINEWIRSDQTFTIRFGMEMLMTFYLDDDFKEEYIDLVSSVKSEEYYVNMMIAWFLATALAKQYDSTIKLIEEQTLSKWVQNKTIQKAVESYRITDEQKAYLKTLKIK